MLILDLHTCSMLFTTLFDLLLFEWQTFSSSCFIMNDCFYGFSPGCSIDTASDTK